MTNLRDIINDFGRKVAEIEADEEGDKNDRYEELLDETMDEIKERLVG